MRKAIQVLVREHKSNYTDLQTLAKGTTETIVTEFYSSIMRPTCAMGTQAVQEHVARASFVLRKNDDLIDRVFDIVVKCFNEPRENILMHIQQLQAMFTTIRLLVSSVASTPPAITPYKDRRYGNPK